MPGRPAATPVAGLALLLTSACSLELPPHEDWSEQLVASGPCYEVNLLDGLDSSSTAEEHALFACLNQTGALDAFAPLDAALDVETRGELVGIELARWLVEAPSHAEGLSLHGLVESGLALLGDAARLHAWGDLLLEAAYGIAAADLPDLADPAAPERLEAGLLLPALPLARALGGWLLDEPDERAWLVERLAGPELGVLGWTAAAVPASSAQPMAELAASWPDHLADAWSRVRDTSNDREVSPTGNSLRDLLDLLLDEAALAGLGAGVRPILEDELAAARVREALATGVASGWIDPLPGQLLRLATEDVDGGSLDEGEDSALRALLRLLARANQPADCSIDLVFTEIDFSLGNLAVAILEQLAAMEPDTAVDSVGVLSDVLGYELSTDILQAVADTGVCPVLDDQLVADLGSIDRLAATPELLDLLIVLLGALEDHVEPVADSVSLAWDAGLVPPVEALLRDLGDAPIAADLATLVPALLEPAGYYDLDELPAGAGVMQLEDLWALVELGLADADHLRALARLLADEDATWTVVDHAMTLLADPEAEARGLLQAWSDWCFEHPDTELGAEAGALLADAALVDPLLRVVESDASAALGETSVEAEGAIPFAARLYLGGTLDLLVETLELVVDMFDSGESSF